MKLETFSGLLGTIAIVGLMGMGASSPSGAGNDDFQIGRSLASTLVQSRTAARILKTEDQTSASCQEWRFVEAEVVKVPSVIPVSAEVKERKWQEQWTLERCGTSVGYRVFYTEVGQGGTYFSVAPHMQP
jgi:hypothetical protein